MEFVILTDKKSVNAIREYPAFRSLEKLCKVRFLAIDDLIAGINYGVTLTLAYARGIIDAGAEQTNTTFVFMNSDFIVADGSLVTLARKISGGSSLHCSAIVASFSRTVVAAVTQGRGATSDSR